MNELESPNGRRRTEVTLRAAGVSRAFEGVQALEDVDLELHSHEVVGLIGPNGAGKTTLVNVLTGFDFPTSGRVELSGQDITRWAPARRGRAGLARTFQHGHLFPGLSVRENVEVSALGVGASPRAARERAWRLLEALGLADVAEEPASTLPHGDERKLGVARALATEPRYRAHGRARRGAARGRGAGVRRRRPLRPRRAGAGVLLIDHNMALIMEVCDRIHVLDQGRTLAEGPPDEIRANIDVASAYLGEGGVKEPDAA